MRWLKYFVQVFQPGNHFINEMDRQLTAQYEDIANSKLNWKEAFLMVDPFDYLIYEKNPNRCLVNCSLNHYGYSIDTQISIKCLDSSDPVLLYPPAEKHLRKIISGELEFSVVKFIDPYDAMELFKLKEAKAIPTSEIFKSKNVTVHCAFKHIPHEGYLKFNYKIDEGRLQAVLSKFTNSWNDKVQEGASGLIHNLDITSDKEKTEVYLDCGSAELKNLNVLYKMISEEFTELGLEIELTGV